MAIISDMKVITGRLLLAALLVLSMPTLAHAQVSNLGELFNTFQQNNVTLIIQLLIVFTFIAGITLIVQGFLKLKEAAASDGAQVKYSEGLLRMAAGSFMVSVVSTIAVGWATLGNADGVWGWGTQAEAGSSVSLEDNNFIAMMGNFAINAAGPLSTVVMAFSVILGISLVASALFGFAKLGSPSGSRDGFGNLATRLIVGILLTNIYWAIEILSNSFGLVGPFEMVGGANFSALGDAARDSLLSYPSEGENAFAGQAQVVMGVAFLALVPFGLIAFVRGLLIIKDSVEANKQASAGAGAAHLLAGIALVNGHSFSCVVMNTLVGGSAWC